MSSREPIERLSKEAVMDQPEWMRWRGWGVVAATAGVLQLWWWAGDGAAWLPLVTGPALALALPALGASEGVVHRRRDPEAAALAALAPEGGDSAHGVEIGRAYLV
jgi:hypothetical protein